MLFLIESPIKLVQTVYMKMTSRNFILSQGICNEPQANGPIDNQSNDDLIGEYNSMRPCTKEYSIYKLDQDQANRKRDQDLFTFCTTEVRKLYSLITYNHFNN